MASQAYPDPKRDIKDEPEVVAMEEGQALAQTRVHWPGLGAGTWSGPVILGSRILPGRRSETGDLKWPDPSSGRIKSAKNQTKRQEKHAKTLKKYKKYNCQIQNGTLTGGF